MASTYSQPVTSVESKPAKFWQNTPVRTSRRGEFWISGERAEVGGKHYQRGPMYVAWEAPERVTQPYPIVLVHGGALQGTEWLDTPDGRPGWAQRLVEAGYAVLVVDRPGHGRSPYNPEVIGPMGPQFAYEEGEEVFFPSKTAKEHTQWPIDPHDASAIDSYIAPFGPLPADIATWQKLDATRLADLLDRIGPAIIMTHSASGSDGWLVADLRPDKVVAIVTVEPMGPAFADTPNIGALSWGLTAAPITYDPPRATAEEVRAADPTALRIPALKGMPVAVVSGEVSVQAKYAPQIRDFLLHAGAAAELLHLPDYGIYGNGHGLIYEKNSDQALQPVLAWLAANTRGSQAQQTMPESQLDLRVVALMRAKDSEVGAVRDALLACQEASREEAGNLMYQVHLDEADPVAFVVVEHWASTQARELHLQTAHFKELGRATDGSGRLNEHVFRVLRPVV